MNEEFIKKMREADQLRKEAFKSLLPETMEGHLEVIHKEMKEMFLDLAKETAKKGAEIYMKSESTKQQEPEKKVNKVKIQ